MSITSLTLIVVVWALVWFIKNQKNTMLLEDIKFYLMYLASKEDNENFRQFHQVWEQFKKSQAGKMKDPRNQL